MVITGYRSIFNRGKDLLRYLPFLVRMKRALLPNPDGLEGVTKVPVLRTFPLFLPNSVGSYDDRARLTIQAINQAFPLLARLAQTLGHEPAPLKDISEAAADDRKLRSVKKLKILFDKHGSDKANHHNYHLLYGSILEDRNSVKRILEIGIGTNNEDVVSNMGFRGHPGASLRAFRDFCPNAMIYGADIDRRILFEEERIATRFIDQTDPASFDALLSELIGDFDLVIDDGLHSPNANIASLDFGLKLVKAGGWVVVEDISASALPVWQSVCAMTSENYSAHLFQAEGAIIFAVQRVSVEC